MADSTYSVVERYMLGWGLVQLCKNKKIIIFALKNILGNLEVSNFQTQYYAKFYITLKYFDGYDKCSKLLF